MEKLTEFMMKKQDLMYSISEQQKNNDSYWSIKSKFPDMMVTSIKRKRKNKKQLRIKREIVKERIEGGANEKAVLRLFINCPFVCINFDFFWLNKARQLYMDF